MPDSFAIGDKAMHGTAQVEVVHLFTDDKCYVATADGTRYRVLKSALIPAASERATKKMPRKAAT